MKITKSQLQKIVNEKYTEENIRSIRPGFGLEPKYLKKIIGMIATENLEMGDPLSWDVIGNQ